jgi:hypothetical protein
MCNDLLKVTEDCVDMGLLVCLRQTTTKKCSGGHTLDADPGAGGGFGKAVELNVLRHNCQHVHSRLTFKLSIAVTDDPSFLWLTMLYSLRPPPYTFPPTRPNDPFHERGGFRAHHDNGWQSL